MALHVPKAPNFSQMLKDGAKHFSGLEEAVFRNIQACKQFTETLRTTYGPLGMNKMVINHIDKLFITRDAATVIRELEVEHPAVKMLVLGSQMQEEEVGDGTNFVIIFAGALLEAAEDMLRMGLKPTEIIEGYEMALEHALSKLDKELVAGEIKDVFDSKQILPLVTTSIMSKQLGNHEFLADLITNACVKVLNEKSCTFNVDNVRVCKILGSGLRSSRLVRGMVFKHEAEGTVTSVTQARVAVYSCPFDMASTETKGTVLIKTAQELKDFSRGEEIQLENLVKSIVEAGVTVIVSGGKVGDMALHYANKHGLMVCRVSSKFELRRLSRATGATCLPRLAPPTREQVGACDRVYTDELGACRVVVFEQNARESCVLTLLVRGATESAMDDVERAIDDGVNTYKVLTKDGRYVCGAGACEFSLASHTAEYAARQPGLAQYPIKCFAEALQTVPRLLADSCGQTSSDTLSALARAHTQSHVHGVNIDWSSATGVEDHGTCVTVDTQQAGIVEPLMTKCWALKYACQAACTVLRVDEIIMAKRAGGPKPPAGNPGYDED